MKSHMLLSFSGVSAAPQLLIAGSVDKHFVAERECARKVRAQCHELEP